MGQANKKRPMPASDNEVVQPMAKRLKTNQTESVLDQKVNMLPIDLIKQARAKFQKLKQDLGSSGDGLKSAQEPSK
jgi:hypothetical protein